MCVCFSPPSFSVCHFNKYNYAFSLKKNAQWVGQLGRAIVLASKGSEQLDRDEDYDDDDDDDD